MSVESAIGSSAAEGASIGRVTGPSVETGLSNGISAGVVEGISGGSVGPNVALSSLMAMPEHTIADINPDREIPAPRLPFDNRFFKTIALTKVEKTETPIETAATEVESEAAQLAENLKPDVAESVQAEISPEPVESPLLTPPSLDVVNPPDEKADEKLARKVIEEIPQNFEMEPVEQTFWISKFAPFTQFDIPAIDIPNDIKAMETAPDEVEKLEQQAAIVIESPDEITPDALAELNLQTQVQTYVDTQTLMPKLVPTTLAELSAQKEAPQDTEELEDEVKQPPPQGLRWDVYHLKKVAAVAKDALSSRVKSGIAMVSSAFTLKDPITSILESAAGLDIATTSSNPDVIEVTSPKVSGFVINAVNATSINPYSVERAVVAEIEKNPPTESTMALQSQESLPFPQLPEQARTTIINREAEHLFQAIPNGAFDQTSRLILRHPQEIEREDRKTAPVKAFLRESP